MKNNCFFQTREDENRKSFFYSDEQSEGIEETFFALQEIASL